VTDKGLYIGGGDDQLYALDPQTGKVTWKLKMGDNTPEGGAYNWASPLVYGSRVYYGTASFCDKPFTQARLWGVNTGTGRAEQEASFVPGDQRGGGIWTSPTVDEATGALYVTIGSGDYYIPHNYSIARLDPRSLSVTDAWQIPTDDQVFDGDWGTTPTLFRDKTRGLMVGAAAKNGYYYAFRADSIGAGPVWRVRIADGGECPQCGDGSISSSAYAYDTIYAAGGYLSLGVTQKFAGTVRALDPTTGAARWIHATTGAVVPALAVGNGLVAAAGDDTVEVLDAASGTLLWEFATEGQVYAAPSIAGGALYVASTDGYVYAFGAGPYPEPARPYKVPRVGSEPPPFSAFRKPVEVSRTSEGEGGSNEQCFAETGQCVRGDLLAFWKERGGLERFGPAVTGELDEAGRVVQYFRNATLEVHPKAGGQGTEVRYGKLDFRLSYYSPHDDNFEPASPISGATYIAETHHNLQEPFLSYWRAHGDVANLGYPVSEPFDETDLIDGQTRRVQYFERARLELTRGQDGTERTTLGALGLHKYQQRYGKLP
jgi:outer membrane protein assembly factor BamB